jgi:hypothetical protein
MPSCSRFILLAQNFTRRAICTKAVSCACLRFLMNSRCRGMQVLRSDPSSWLTRLLAKIAKRQVGHFPQLTSEPSLPTRPSCRSVVHLE